MIKTSIKQLFVASISLFLLSCGSDDNTKPSNVSTEPKDAEGYLYKTVVIENKTWFSENLKTTKYKNGNAIDNVTIASEWGTKTTGAFRESRNPQKYGYLYNYAAITDARGICPNGWHVATEDDFLLLIKAAGGGANGGMNLKTNTSDWSFPNENHVNKTNSDSLGFTALPNGFVTLDGTIFQVGNTASFWISTPPNSSQFTEAYDLYSSQKSVQPINANKIVGLSCRRVKD